MTLHNSSGVIFNKVTVEHVFSSGYYLNYDLVMFFFVCLVFDLSAILLFEVLLNRLRSYLMNELFLILFIPKTYLTWAQCWILTVFRGSKRVFGLCQLYE